jgi:hypothetical protein
MRRRYESRGIRYFGKELEADIFGNYERRLTQQQRKERAERFRAITEKGGYQRYNDAIDFIRDFYPEGESANPNQEFANDLRLEVMDGLGLEESMSDSLEFYSAVGTPLDVFHGVDAWIQIKGVNGRVAYVTMDATLDKSKDEYKSDIIIRDIADPDTENGKFIEQVEQYGTEVAELLRNKISQQGLQI